MIYYFQCRDISMHVLKQFQKQSELQFTALAMENAETVVSRV